MAADRAIHGAILAGAHPEAVAGALGESVKSTFERWREWAICQRDFVSNDKPGVSAQGYEVVAQRFTAVGVNAEA